MNFYMQQAIEEAQYGIKNKAGGPFGCVIVKDGKIIGSGHNQVLEKHDCTCHGEMQAIRNACKKLKSFDLSESILFTTGYPCPMCMGAIFWAGVAKVYYACNVKDTEIIGFRDNNFYERMTNLTSSFIQELDREEGLKLYNQYKEEDHKLY